MKNLLLLSLWLGLILLSLPATAQLPYPYFPPPGMSYNSGTQVFTQGSTTNGLTPSQFLIDGNSSDAIDGHASVLYQNFSIVSGILAHALVPDSLSITAGFGDYLDVWRNGSISGACQQGTTINAWYPCRVTLGTNTASYNGASGAGCQEIIGPLNAPGNGVADLGFRLRCMDNDSAGFLFGSHASGTEAYGWGYLSYSGDAPTTRYGLGIETVPSRATAVASAQRMPHCKGALNATLTGYVTGNTFTVSVLSSGTVAVAQTLSLPTSTPSGFLISASLGGGQYTVTQGCQSACGSAGSPLAGTTYDEISTSYECLIASPGQFILQIADGASASSDLGGPLNGVTALKVNKTLGTVQAQVTVGDNINSTSTTNIVGPSAANTQINGNPAVGTVGTLTTGNCLSTHSGTADTLGDAGSPCVLVVNYVAISNVASLSGSQTFTQVGGTSATAPVGSTVLLTGQSTGSQNGPYLIPLGGGSWTRLGDFFQTGNVISQNAAILARDTTVLSTYALNTTLGATTVGTTAQNWTPLLSLFVNNISPSLTVSGAGSPETITGGASLATSGVGPGGALNLKGGAASTTTTGNANGGPITVTGGMGGSTSGNGNGGAASLIGGPGSTTTAASTNGGDAIVRAGSVGTGTGSNGTARIQDSASTNWAIANTIVGLNLPPKTANGGIPCNAGAAGSFMSVNDASSPAIGSTYANGGSSNALIECNGSSWIIVSGSPTKFPAHLAYAGTAPAVSACGTGPSIDAHATDASGTVTVGTVAAASCTVTFNVAFTTWNHCRVTSQSVIASFSYSYTLSAITVTGTSLIGDLFDYSCDGL